VIWEKYVLPLLARDTHEEAEYGLNPLPVEWLASRGDRGYDEKERRLPARGTLSPRDKTC
jgi:hypothetical protein